MPRKIAMALAALLVASFAAPAAAAESEVEAETQALRDAGLGWGAIAHLQGIASSYGLSAEELLVATPFVDSKQQPGLGRLIRELDVSGRAALERQARNFDQLTDAIATEGDDDEARTDPTGKAELLAEALTTDASVVDASEVMALRDADIGWGAVFKLIRFAQVMEVGVDELLAATPIVDGEHEFGFGNLKNQLDDKQLEALQEGPRSLGHVISSSKRSERAEEKAANGSDERGHGRDKPKPAKPAKPDKSDEDED
jgi:hypothetical protein